MQQRGHTHIPAETPLLRDTQFQSQKYLSFFSIGDSMKICKFILKIEQALIKYYGLKKPSIMQKIYEDLEKKKRAEMAA